MKNISVKKKITIWFSCTLFIIMAIMVILTISISLHVFNRELRANLENQVLINVEQIEHYNSLKGQILDAGDQYLAYGDGFLEIDDDFCNYYNGIYTALVDENNNLLYGECPVRLSSDEAFTFTSTQAYRYNGTRYYIYEKKLHGSDLDGLWVRGTASLTEGSAFLYSILKFSWFMLPLLGILTVIGGYILTRSSFKPLEKIVGAANSIGSGDDLSARINLKGSDNEFTRLANTFDLMFDRLENSFKREQQFTSDVSHELRTPLSVILAQSEFSLEMAESEEEYREALEVIHLKASQMNDLISQLLFFSRADSGRQNINLTSINLTSLIKDECSHFSSDRNISLNLNLEADVYAECDKGLFIRVLTNLINNAHQYGIDNGYINVHLAKTSDGDSVVLSVSDNGVGIPEDKQEKIWNRFYQIDPSRSSESAGLGLSMVKEIVKLHSGSITVNSTPWQGSEFIITLPAKSNNNLSE